MHFGRVLVAGCGGTGSEVIKLLLQNTFDELILIDYDKVEKTNISRQYFFNYSSIGKNKAHAIKESLFKNNYNVKSYDIKIEDFECNKRFDYVFSCLDNIESRMALNLIDFKILMDLGIEGDKCHVKRVEKGYDSCLYCIRDLYTTRKFAPCTPKGIDKIKNRGDALQYFCAVYDENNVCISEFNKHAILNGWSLTNIYEVNMLREEIIPNVCYINAICASLAFILIENYQTDYIFYNKGEIVRLKIAVDKECFICSDKK